MSLGGTTLTVAGIVTYPYPADVFVTCFHANGSVVWAKAFGGSGNDRSNAVATRADGTAVMTGRFQGNASFGVTSLTSVGSRNYGDFVLSLRTDKSVLEGA